MSETLCTLRGAGGGGGRVTETILWTNSAPTTDFTAQAITLSDDINNYDYISINFAYATSYNAGDCNSSFLVSIADLKKNGYNTSTRHNISAMGVQNQSNTNYSRMMFYVDATTLRFGGCFQVGSSTASNANCIPLVVKGIKNIGGVRTNEKYDCTPMATVAGGTSPTYSTKGRAKAIWQFYGRTDQGWSAVRTNVNPYTGEIDNSVIYMSRSDSNAWAIQTGGAFTVTDNSVTTTQLSANSRVASLAYTY